LPKGRGLRTGAWRTGRLCLAPELQGQRRCCRWSRTFFTIEPTFATALFSCSRDTPSFSDQYLTS
jgi:hypothetical protein